LRSGTSSRRRFFLPPFSRDDGGKRKGNWKILLLFSLINSWSRVSRRRKGGWEMEEDSKCQSKDLLYYSIIYFSFPLSPWHDSTSSRSGIPSTARPTAGGSERASAIWATSIGTAFQVTLAHAHHPHPKTQTN
jgi:hypothetical protein